VGKEASFLARINPSEPGNLPNVIKKPATESRPAQGRQEYAKVLKVVLKPP